MIWVWSGRERGRGGRHVAARPGTPRQSAPRVFGSSRGRSHAQRAAGEAIAFACMPQHASRHTHATAIAPAGHHNRRPHLRGRLNRAFRVLVNRVCVRYVVEMGGHRWCVSPATGLKRRSPPSFVLTAPPSPPPLADWRAPRATFPAADPQTRSQDGLDRVCTRVTPPVNPRSPLAYIWFGMGNGGADCLRARALARAKLGPNVRGSIQTIGFIIRFTLTCNHPSLPHCGIA